MHEKPEPRAVGAAMRKGARLKCPACGVGKIFASYLKAAPNCTHCGQQLDCHRADDAPPYFTIVVLGHIIIPLMYLLERAYAPPLWVHISLFSAITIIGSLVCLPIIKGAIISLQWALRMHGFGEEPHPENSPSEEEAIHE